MREIKVPKYVYNCLLKAMEANRIKIKNANIVKNYLIENGISLDTPISNFIPDLIIEEQNKIKTIQTTIDDFI